MQVNTRSIEGTFITFCKCESNATTEEALQNA